jgi:hypothetical protein
MWERLKQVSNLWGRSNLATIFEACVRDMERHHGVQRSGRERRSMRRSEPVETKGKLAKVYRLRKAGFPRGGKGSERQEWKRE